MRRYRNIMVVGIFFLVFGLIFVSFTAIDGFREYDTYKNRVRVEGKVEDTNYKTKTTLITYTANNTVIQKELNLIDTSLNKDDTVIVYYNANDPTKAFIKTQIIYILTYFAVGLGCMITFVVLFIIVLVKLSKDIKLIKTGKRIEATIDNITINRSITRCPYKVVLTYKVGKKVYKFVNNSVWFNIKDIVDDYKIKTIPVYVTDNYKRYYIDLSTIEQLNS